MTNSSLPNDEESSALPASEFLAVATRYRANIAAMRDFYVQLNPIAASITEAAQTARRDALKEQIERFKSDSGEDALEDVAALEPLFDALLADNARITTGATAPSDVEGKHIQLKGHESIDLFLAMLPTIVRAPTRHPELLRRGIFNSLVAVFELHLGELARRYYELHKDVVGKGDNDKIFTLDDLRGFESVEKAVDFVVSNRVDSLLRGAVVDWEKFFDSKMKIKLRALIPCFAEWSELLQRRHLLVHNGGTVDLRYLQRVEWDDVPFEKPEVGKSVDIDDGYLERAFDLFEVAGEVLCLTVWKKLVPDEKRVRLEGDFFSEVFPGILQVVYAHLLAGRWFVAEHLAEWCATDDQGTEDERLLGTFNRWQCIKRQGRYHEIASEIDAFDDSAKDPKFRLALACLRDRPDDAIAIAKGGAVDVQALEEWPILQELRAAAGFHGLLAQLKDDRHAVSDL